MSTAGARRARGPALAGWTTLAATGLTLAVVAVPFLRFAYRAPALHVVLETANAVIALLVAYLVYGRLRQSRRMQDLLLVLALCTVALANLALTALPSAVSLSSGEQPDRWAALVIRLLGTLVLSAAALTTRRRVDRRTAALTAAAVAAAVLLIAAAGLLLDGSLPPTVDPAAALDDASRPRLVAHPAVHAVQAVGALLYGVAAAGFGRQAQRTGDELLRWVGAGCVLAAFARLHYLLYPSLYSDLVYTGDLLRLGFYLFLLVGASREIRSYWELRTQAAVLDDRRRMARDLHDGLAQELAYIAAQSQRTDEPGHAATMQRIEAAANRAVDEARLAIAALSRPAQEPFHQALERAVDDLARRYDTTVTTDLAPVAGLDTARAEGTMRIVAEAVRNAVRHGAASRVCVQLRDSPVRLTVRDDGRGFDVAAPRCGGYGLTGMHERAAALGAALCITSSPGAGTTVELSWP